MEHLGRGIAVVGVWAALACIAIFAPPTLGLGWLLFVGILATAVIY